MENEGAPLSGRIYVIKQHCKCPIVGTNTCMYCYIPSAEGSLFKDLW